jgi:hypothetical protein
MKKVTNSWTCRLTRQGNGKEVTRTTEKLEASIKIVFRGVNYLGAVASADIRQQQF